MRASRRLAVLGAVLLLLLVGGSSGRADSQERDKNVSRALFELGGVLGLSTAVYYINYESNQVDWDYGVSESFRARFINGDAYQFDNNNFLVNTPGHPVAGAIYYTIGRSNGFSLFESFLWSLGGSLFWEYLGEYREIVSLNDMALTPLSGSVIGEVFYQLGEFFRRGQPYGTPRALSWVFGTVSNIHDRWDKTTPRQAARLDAMGFPDDIWHRFTLHVAGGMSQRTDTERSRAEFDLGLHTEILNVYGADRPGEISRGVSGGVFTELQLRATLGAEGLLGFLFFTRMTFYGYYVQNLSRQESGHLQGSRFLGGLSAAFVDVRRQYEEFDDYIDIAHVIGPSLDWAWYHKSGFRLRASFDVYVDFAAVRSFAIAAYARDHSLEGVRDVLKNRRYYFAYGFTGRGSLIAAYGPFELGGKVSYDLLFSIDGRDRFQEEITNPISLSDSRLASHLWVAYTLPDERLKIGLTVEYLWRAGEADTVEFSVTELRYLAQLAVVF